MSNTASTVNTPAAPITTTISLSPATRPYFATGSLVVDVPVRFVEGNRLRPGAEIDVRRMFGRQTATLYCGLKAVPLPLRTVTAEDAATAINYHNSNHVKPALVLYHMKPALALPHVAPTKSYTCIWWNGGTHRGRWQSCAAGDLGLAESHRAECERMGYLTKVVSTGSLAHGLPWTRLPEESIHDWTPGKDGFLYRRDIAATGEDHPSVCPTDQP